MIHLRSLVFFALTFLCACSGGGGGGGTPTLLVGAEISGDWSLRSEVVAISGVCLDTFVGEADVSTTVIARVDESNVILDQGTSDELLGRLNGAVLTLSRTSVNSAGRTVEFTAEVTFSPDGNQFTARVTERELLNGQEACRVTSDVQGVRYNSAGFASVSLSWGNSTGMPGSDLDVELEDPVGNLTTNALASSDKDSRLTVNSSIGDANCINGFSIESVFVDRPPFGAYTARVRTVANCIGQAPGTFLLQRIDSLAPFSDLLTGPVPALGQVLEARFVVSP